jgi:hypothetical protein
MSSELLARLRIPTGWTVTSHTLREPSEGADLPPSIFDLDEDLLQLESPSRGILVDVGWYPSFDPEGRFHLRCIQLGSTIEESCSAWENPIRVFECRSFRELRDQLEAWLNDDELVVTRPWNRRDPAPPAAG